MVAALFGVQNLLLSWEIPSLSIDFGNIQWAISALVPRWLVAPFVWTDNIFGQFFRYIFYFFLIF